MNINHKEYSSLEIKNIMNSCEKYREKLITYCKLHFDFDYEQAEDCVQSAFVALYESLINGNEIQNYRAWLYKVTLNINNKVIKGKLQRNEYEFQTNEEKDYIINNCCSYNPDYIDSMVTDELIERRALEIIASLNDKDRKLYIAHYCEKKTFVEIGKELCVNDATIRKRHEKLRKKIINKIKEYEKL